MKPQQVRLWLDSLSSGQALLRTEYSGIFNNGSFSPPCARSMRGFSLYIHCENLMELQEVKLTKVCVEGSPYDWIPLDFFILKFPHGNFRNLSIVVSGFPIMTLVPAGSCSGKL